MKGRFVLCKETPTKAWNVKSEEHWQRQLQKENSLSATISLQTRETYEKRDTIRRYYFLDHNTEQLYYAQATHLRNV